MSNSNGLVNATNNISGCNFSSMTASEIYELMSACVDKMRQISTVKDISVMLPDVVYNKLATFRFRKSKVKKGCGKYRFVLIGPPRITLRASK